MKITTQLLIILFVFAGAAQVVAQDEEKKRKNRYGTHHHFEIDLGINNVLEDGSSPSESNALYAVKPWGSWYVALKSINETHVTGKLFLNWGPEVSWYNFKFQNEGVRIGKTNDGLVFTEAAGDINPVKSKLTAAYLNISLVPMLKFGENKRHNDWFDWTDWNDDNGFRIGAGGYAGYRLASYTKYVAKEDGDRDKDKDKDGYFLNDFRYGIRFQVGYRNLDVFVNYDLNELFVENKGPQLNAFSFGIVL